MDKRAETADEDEEENELESREADEECLNVGTLY